jgi:thermospermine synthase
MASIKSDDGGRQQYTRRLWVSERALASPQRARGRAFLRAVAARAFSLLPPPLAHPSPATTTLTTQQLEEDLADDLKWTMQVKEVLFSGKSDFQEVDLIHTGPFGRVSFVGRQARAPPSPRPPLPLPFSRPPLQNPPTPKQQTTNNQQTLFLDGKVQSSEVDEWVYHELLVHPSLLHHPNPKRVFIAGGGEGATAREVLRHPTVEQLVMVDIDKVVCDFCRAHLPANAEAFASPKLTLINEDARAELAKFPDGHFDVIIGDLADPLDGGPCYQLYTREFYETVVKAKLAPGGIFVTQSGPAGVLSATEVFTCINATMKSVFPVVVPYTQHMPVFCDVWGWNMAFRDAEGRVLTTEELDARIQERGIAGKPLEFLDGETFSGLRTLNKPLRLQLAEETQVYSADCGRFIHGKGSAANEGGGKAATGVNGK